ncbi:MAG: hypothetical protein ISQ06_01590 [Planctomycetaceae bacterium]|nr:hypothetical protein [Planctomycetaceae bacterium]
MILSAEIYYGHESEGNTLLDSVNTTQGNLQQADSEAEIKEAVGDKGYHKNETLAKWSEGRSANIHLRVGWTEPSLDGQAC